MSGKRTVFNAEEYIGQKDKKLILFGSGKNGTDVYGLLGEKDTHQRLL
mgnify:CR=1 FL=1